MDWRGWPGDIAREAFDDYEEKMVERSPNVRLIREEGA
jgi:hypothetical protein